MIEFYAEEIDFELSDQEGVASWIMDVITRAGASVEGITYIFCSDEYLLQINRDALDHDYYTDIITFPLHESGQPIQSDIFISVDRVGENAREFGHSFLDELHRVMIHGVLHLLGFDDHGEENVLRMRAAEDEALALRRFL